MKKSKLKKPFFFNGAFATYYNHLTNIDEPCEYTNFNNRDVVLKIHKEYIESDVEAIKTNTYSANISLSKDKDIVINSFKNMLSSGKKVIAVELDSPVNTDIGYVMRASKRAKESETEIDTVTDPPLARTRADSTVIASKIKKIDAIPHLSCRDKNHIGLKASLPAASVENIDNILAITGGPIAQTERSEYKGVFSFYSYNLMTPLKRIDLMKELIRYISEKIR